MIPIDMSDPVHAQAERGRQLNDLMIKCQESGVWDGLVRIGPPVTSEQRAKVAHLSDDSDVQDQLFLQHQDGKLEIPA